MTAAVQSVAPSPATANLGAEARLDEAVRVAVARADGGRLGRPQVDAVAEEMRLPARAYAAMAAAVSNAGVTIVDDASNGEVDNADDDDSGYDADGLGLFMAR